MAVSSREKNAVFIQYTFFRHDGSIIIISFKNTDNFSDNQKREISDYIKELFEVDADTFQFTLGISLKYNVGLSIESSFLNKEKACTFLLSK